MKKLSYLLMALALFGFIQKPQSAQGQAVIKLKIVDSFPVGHINHQEMLHFIKRFEELTKGTVKIEYYPAEQLGKLKDYLNLCSQGMADIAYVPPSYHTGSVPLNNIGILPFFSTAAEGTEIYRRLMDTCPELQQEFMKYGVRPLLVYSVGQWEVGAVKRPLRSPEDLKGLKARTPGGLYDRIAKQYGIITVNIPAPDAYEALQRGIVEGSLGPFPSVKAYRLNELLRHHTHGARMGGYPSTYVINERKWQSLPKDIQKALVLAAGQFAKEFSESWDKEGLKLAKEFEKGGMVIYRVTEKDIAKWEAPAKGIEEEWIQDLEKKGLPARKVFMEFKKICQEVAK